MASHDIIMKNSTYREFDRRIERLKTDENYDTFHYLYERFQFHPPNSHFNSIRHEIKDCLSFGLNQAAITLTNHYLERFLKVSLIHKEIGMKMTDMKVYNERAIAATKKFGGIVLGESITKAYQMKIISESEKEQLTLLKNTFRNPFSHYDIDRTFGKEKTNLKKFSILEPTKEIESITMDISNFIPFHDMKQSAFAKETAFAYFVYIDDLCNRYEIRNYPKCLELQINKEIDFVKVFTTNFKFE